MAVEDYPASRLRTIELIIECEWQRGEAEEENESPDAPPFVHRYSEQCRIEQTERMNEMVRKGDEEQEELGDDDDENNAHETRGRRNRKLSCGNAIDNQVVGNEI